MGSAAGAGGTGQGSSVFLPQNQPQAGQAFLSTLLPLFNLSANAGQGTPAGQNYPGASNLIQQFLTGSLTGGGPTAFNDYENQALGGAQQASGGYQSIYPELLSAVSSLTQGGAGGMGALGPLLLNAFNPAYSWAVQQAGNNPYLGQALQGAQQGAGYGSAAAAAMSGLGNNLIGQGQDLGGQANNLFNQGNNLFGMSGQAWNQAAPYFGAAGQVLNQGFDPQSAVFNRTQQQLMDQTNAANAAAGIGSTPYGASTTANALGNFDINWQNNLLGREAQAGSAASGLAGTGTGLERLAGSLAGTGGGLIGQGANVMGQGANISNLGAGLLGQAPGMAANSAMLPSNVFTGNLGQILSALNAQNNAGIAGATGYGNLLGSSGNAFNQAGGLGGSLTSGLASATGLPYQTGSTLGNNALSALTNLTNLGNNQFMLPQQVINDLESYLGLGQSASGLSANIGNMGFNQLAQGLGGGLSAANSLFGNNGLFGGGGGGLGGLFGGGGAGAAGIGGDFSSGPLGEFASTTGGGGGGFLSSLPLIGSLAGGS